MFVGIACAERYRNKSWKIAQNCSDIKHKGVKSALIQALPMNESIWGLWKVAFLMADLYLVSADNLENFDVKISRNYKINDD